MSGANKRILVVDDEEGLLLTLAANLELEGFEVLTAGSGEAALETLAKEKVDLVITDVRMPGISGVQLFQEIRKREPGLPVMIMTAFALESVVEEALKNGIFTVVAKPFDVSHILALASRAVRRPTVLVVDDDDSVAKYLADALSQAGVRATAVFDAQSAFDAVRSGTVDVCIADVVMPGMDGAEMTKKLLAWDPSITVIAISGQRAQELIARIASFGAVECMEKPIDPETLVKTVARARGRAR